MVVTDYGGAVQGVETGMPGRHKVVDNAGGVNREPALNIQVI
jgi:hypothetical protein